MIMQKLAAPEHGIGACAFVPSEVSKAVLINVKAMKFWDPQYQSFLPGSPAAVPKIKAILASADFRQVKPPPKQELYTCVPGLCYCRRDQKMSAECKRR